MTLLLWILGGVVLVTAILIYCVAPGKMSPEAEKSAKHFFGLNCAHRGLHTKDQKIPENSIASFIAARDAGYGIELDIQISKDGQVIVFHDDNLKRACGVDETAKNVDWSELSELSLFSTDEKIPLFADALDAIGDAPIVVELKPIGSNYAEFCQKTLDILREKGKFWCIESFDPRICRWFRKNAPDVLRGQLSCPPSKFFLISKFNAFLLGHLLTNFISRPHYLAYRANTHPITIKLCRLFKPMTAVWTVTPEHDIEFFEKYNDIVIFEYYNPPAKFK